MLIRIDPQSADPIYEQIAFRVKDAAARGDLPAGTKLPSVRELARELSINPNTVVRAYDALERDGLLVRRKGSGCFVTDRGSALSESRKRSELDGLMGRTVTEAFHLGFDAAAIRDALERGLEGLSFDDAQGGKNSTNKKNGKGSKERDA